MKFSNQKAKIRREELKLNDPLYTAYKRLILEPKTQIGSKWKDGKDSPKYSNQKRAERSC